MTVSFGKRYKIVLLRGAARRGIRCFLRQAGLILADICCREKHLVFRMTAQQVLAADHTFPKNLQFHEAMDWDELPEHFRLRLSKPEEGIDWGNREWFAKGWHLWIGAQDGQIAVLSWWRSSAQSTTFFCPIPADAELLWHVTVLPEYRGHNLHVLCWIALLRSRVAKGTRSFYVNCRDYNTPSHLNICKIGFKLFGCCKISRFTRRRVWIPIYSA